MTKLSRSELRNKIMTILYQINVYKQNKMNFNIDDVINMVKNNDESLTFKSNVLYLFEELKEKMM